MVYLNHLLPPITAFPSLPSHYSRMSASVVICVRDGEDVGAALVSCDEGPEADHLLIVSEVLDPVGALLGRGGDVPLHRGVALSV